MPEPVKPVVAVVDDDHRVLESLQELLESAGYDVRVFQAAAALLEHADIAAIQCLISDIRMPVMDGWQLEARVAVARPDLPVIFITGDDLAQREAKLRRIGRPHRTLFRKPFAGEELLAAVTAAVQRRPP